METKKFNVMQSAESNEHLEIYYVANDVATSEINEAVYAVMCHVAQKVLDRSTCHISGDHTAAEIAGYIDSRWNKVLTPLTDKHHTMAPAVQVVIGEGVYTKHHKPTFTCIFPTDQVFEQMAEWEGVMGLAPKKQHLFGCEVKGEPDKGKLVPYTRCHQPKATNPYSAAREATRINKRLEVLGQLRGQLSSEGMKRALAVLCAAKQWEDNRAKYRMALEVMRRRLWKDYGTDQYAGPMSYTARDFEPGPEIWKQVDVDYANMLRKLFFALLEAAPAPKWISTKDYVQVKDKEKVVDKLQGKLYVTNVYARLDSTGEKLVWFASVVAAKGREWQFEVDRLEPWTEPEKAKKKSDVRGKKSAATTKPKAKAANPEPSTVNPEPTLAERLRAALLQQFKQAA